MSDRVIGNKYLINKEIGHGSFGIIYNGYNITTKDKVAIKVERKRDDNKLTLRHESHILTTLKGIKGVVQLRWYGHEDALYFMVIDLLGITLERYKKLHEPYVNNKRTGLSKNKIVGIGVQMIDIIELVHKHRIIHRDIKPENFLFGRGDDTRLYLIDFGLAKQYMSIGGEHILYRSDKNLIGTVRYASVNSHDNKELSRRDDIESIGYLILYLIMRKLPWQGITHASDSIRLDMIRHKKQNISLQNIPDSMKTYFNYIGNVSFAEEPNYVYLKTLVRSLGKKLILEET